MNGQATGSGAPRGGRVASDIALALLLGAVEAALLVFTVFLLLMDNWGEPVADRPVIILFAVGAALTGTAAVLLLRARLRVSGVTQALVALTLAGAALVGMTQTDSGTPDTEGRAPVAAARPWV